MMELVYMYQQNKDLVVRIFVKDYFGWLKKAIVSHCDYKTLIQHQDELIQLALVKLCDAFEMYRYDMQYDFLGYYFLIVKRMIIDFKRVMYRKVRMLDYYANINSYSIEDREVEYFSSLKQKAQHEYKVNQLYSMMMDELQALKPLDKEVFQYKLKGYTAVEISMILGIEEYKVNYIVRKVRKQLKFQIDE